MGRERKNLSHVSSCVVHMNFYRCLATGSFEAFLVTMAERTLAPSMIPLMIQSSPLTGRTRGQIAFLDSDRAQEGDAEAAWIGVDVASEGLCYSFGI